MNNKVEKIPLTEEAKNSILYVSDKPDIIMEKGKGMYLWDTTGKKYLDFIAGWAVNSLGHCPEVIIKALEYQSKTLINSSPAFYNKPMINFSKLLINNSCFDRVFFSTSGAEANESAIKLAKKYGTKYLNGAFEIITTTNSFHGRTLATMAATGKPNWKNLYKPYYPGFSHVAFNDIKAIKNKINKNTCAIMLEPIQGEGGINLGNLEYFKEIRKLCTDNGILLILDEIQTGIGRTGKLFAYNHFDIEPDIMTIAKGIGGGFPLSAMLTKNKLNIFNKGDQGGTYTGQPLAMSVGYAVLNRVIEEKLWLNAEIQGKYIIENLNKLKDNGKIKSVRGMGLLIGIVLNKENGDQIVNSCLKNGLIVNSPKSNMLRLMPSLTVEKNHINNMIDIIKEII
ncbi:MAG: acetylornithine/succinylornithine family transaminase [Clostridiales bacterium]